MGVCLLSLPRVHHASRQERDGIHVAEGAGDASIGAEELHRAEWRNRPDAERQAIGDAGQGDRHRRLAECFAHAIGDAVSYGGVAPHRHDHKHVVDADTCQIFKQTLKTNDLSPVNIYTCGAIMNNIRKQLLA